MVFEPFGEGARWLRSSLPTKFKFSRPKLNYITVHYMYMIGLTILGSIILYPTDMSYINAFFFAAGSATQSGLNPVDVNELHLYQQVTMMLIACIANPIFINTVVVFVRLYWFEKRFVVYVEERRAKQRPWTRTFSRNLAGTFSRAKSEPHDTPDPRRLEMGIDGRDIRVLHDTTIPNGMSGSTPRIADAAKEFAEKMGLEHQSQSVSPTPPEGSNASDQNGSGEEKASEDERVPFTPLSWLGMNPGLKKDIKFADDVEATTSDCAQPSPKLEPTFDREAVNKHIQFLEDRRRESQQELDAEIQDFADEVPSQTAGHAQQSPPLERVLEGEMPNRHVQIVERQERDAKQTKGTFHIPGPRDFDRGELPKTMDGDEDNELQRPTTSNTLGPVPSLRGRTRQGPENPTEELNGDDHPVRRGITIDEPKHPGHLKRESEDEEQPGEHHNPLSKIMSGLTHRRHRSGGPKLSDIKGTMAKTFNSVTTARSRIGNDDSMPYLSWQATTGRNSAFLGLSAAQREELGGIEYRSLKTLATILIVYYVGFHLLGMIILLPWIMHTQPWRDYVRSNGVNPVWWGFFTPASMFNDLGFTLTPDSMNSFGTAVLPMLFGSFLIIIGNTGFPVMLRFVIWVASILVPTGSSTWEELRFLLDHPRRCFTLLFPSRATWWLFWILVLLNVIDLFFFIILDLNDPVVTALAPGYRVLDGWFQAASTRTAGFSCVNLAGLHPAIQVSYLIMMYISVFPIAISVRRTNVYEERSLGIFGGEEEGDESEPSYVGQHLRRQLSFDLWYVFLGFFIICIVEGGRLANTNQYAFTMFSVLFEIVSAYGTVGLSLGYPNINASFSAELKVISKLVIVAMMIRGRHRGLPYALDRAILLPSEGLHIKEAEEADRRHARRSENIDREGAWEDGELDAFGLPKQHTGGDGGIDPMTAGAGGGDRGSPEGMRKMVRRRSSAYTTGSGEGRRKHERRRSIGTMFAGALRAGPTFSKYE